MHLNTRTQRYTHTHMQADWNTLTLYLCWPTFCLLHCPYSYVIYENAMCCLCCYVIHGHLMFFTTCSVFGVGVLMGRRGRHWTDWEQNSQWFIMHQKSQSREIIENKRPLCKVSVANEQSARVISFIGICKPSFVPLHGFLLLHFSFSLLLKSNALEFVFFRVWQPIQHFVYCKNWFGSRQQGGRLYNYCDFCLTPFLSS